MMGYTVINAAVGYVLSNLSVNNFVYNSIVESPNGFRKNILNLTYVLTLPRTDELKLLATKVGLVTKKQPFL